MQDRQWWHDFGQVARSSSVKAYAGNPAHFPFKISPPIFRECSAVFSAQRSELRADLTVVG